MSKTRLAKQEQEILREREIEAFFESIKKQEYSRYLCLRYFEDLIENNQCVHNAAIDMLCDKELEKKRKENQTRARIAMDIFLRRKGLHSIHE